MSAILRLRSGTASGSHLTPLHLFLSADVFIAPFPVALPLSYQLFFPVLPFLRAFSLLLHDL